MQITKEKITELRGLLAEAVKFQSYSEDLKIEAVNALPALLDRVEELEASERDLIDGVHHDGELLDKVRARVEALEKQARGIGCKDRLGKDIEIGNIVHWSDGGEDFNLEKRIRTRWDRIALVEKKRDIEFHVIDSPDKETKQNAHIFHYGNFIYKDTENHLTVVAKSADEYREKFYNAGECMAWVVEALSKNTADDGGGS